MNDAERAALQEKLGPPMDALLDFAATAVRYAELPGFRGVVYDTMWTQSVADADATGEETYKLLAYMEAARAAHESREPRLEHVFKLRILMEKERAARTTRTPWWRRLWSRR